MDGFAVRSQDTVSASVDSPVCLNITGESAAGMNIGMQVAPGEAMRIDTGAMVPVGADAIIPVEDAVMQSESLVKLGAPACSGDFIRRAGSDLGAGDSALPAGAQVRSFEVAVAASLGRSTLMVHRQPRVAVLSSGDELVDPGTGPLRAGQIYDSNCYALAAQASAGGGAVVFTSHMADTLQSTADTLEAAAATGADIIDHLRRSFSRRLRPDQTGSAASGAGVNRFLARGDQARQAVCFRNLPGRAFFRASRQPRLGHGHVRAVCQACPAAFVRPCGKRLPSPHDHSP